MSTMPDPASARLTEAVLDSFARTASPRLRQVLRSLVTHLHAFAQDVRLTEEEWFAGIEFLTRTGQISDERRQEFVLASDVLGLSMLVIGLNHGHFAEPGSTEHAADRRRGPGDPPAATESTVLGPFFAEGSPRFDNGDDIANGAPGQPCLMQGSVRSVTGAALAGARLEVWQADDDGFYDVQYGAEAETRARGHLHADGDGRWWFWSVRPEAYPIPDDGPVGTLLRATGRSPMRPAHVHFMITADGHRRLITHVFDGADPHLDSDAVFGVRPGLVTTFARHEPGTAPDGTRMDVPYHTMRYDFVMEPDRRG